MGDNTLKIQAIRNFTEAGFRLIPLNGKTPLTQEWQKTKPFEFGEKELSDQNYGVALGASDLVIDIDPRNFVKGDDPVKRLIKEIGVPLDDTFIVQTGGGGLHIYFTKPADSRIVNQLKEFHGIEFKSVGRQVVGPGSIHPDTLKEYKIVKGTLQEIKEVPAKLHDLIRRRPQDIKLNGAGVEYQDDAATQARFIDFLKYVAEPSVAGQGGDNNAFRVAATARDYALSPATTLELMLELWNPKCSPPWTVEDLKVKVKNAYEYAQKTVGNAHPSADFHPISGETIKPKRRPQWIFGKNGKPINNFSNLLTFMQIDGSDLKDIFGYNEFTGRVEFLKAAPWHDSGFEPGRAVGDNDLKLLKGYLAVSHKFETNIQKIEEAVVNAAFALKFHPVREYLNKLDKWDGEKRLDTWLIDYLGAGDTEFIRAAGRKTICAAVMRVLFPGCKYDYVLVLEGAQGIGKSSVCKILGGEWASDSPIDPHSKDTIQLMQGRWIIEIAELEYTRKSEADAIKAFLTRSTDMARLAFGRVPSHFPRQSIFIASKNPGADGTYLKDDTGNRRYWPVYCEPIGGQVDFAGLAAARDQLFAEALVKLKKGEKLFMDTKALEIEAQQAVATRHAEHHWTEVIASWIAMQKEKPAFLTSREIYLGAIGGTDRTMGRKEQLGIATAMRGLGWAPGVVRVGVRTVRGYVPFEVQQRKRSRKKAVEAAGVARADKELLGALI